MGKVKNSKGKKNLSDSVQNKTSTKKLNPFEIHINRQKHDVIGRKLKNDRGLPGVARAKALKKRKATLLQEYKNKDKSNKFVDRRIGERSSLMSNEDRSIARFAAERAKSNKKSMFNLADDEILTHKGQTLNEIEKFDDPRSDEEDDEGGKLQAEFVKDAHFGGGIFRKRQDDEKSAQSRQDIINQLITESKKRKAEKQQESEKTLALTEKLDAAWKDLQPIVLKAKKSKSGDDAEENGTEEKVKLDPYDRAFREMKFEAKGTPSDRLKSEEEMATDTKEQLDQLEEDRIKRMHGLFEQTKIIKHRSADDLDDGFQLETPEETLAYDDDGCMTLTSTEAKTDQADGEGEDESGDESGDESADNFESSDDDDSSNTSEVNMDQLEPEIEANEEPFKNTSSDTEDENVDDFEDLKLHLSSDDESDHATAKNTPAAEEETEPVLEKPKVDFTALKKSMEEAREQLPFTFEVPDTYEKLQELLSKHNFTKQSIILERMIKCNHPTLKLGNKESLGSLFAFLLQWLHDNAKEMDKTFSCSLDSFFYDGLSSEETIGSDVIVRGLDVNFELVATLVPHLYNLAQTAGAGNARQCVAAVLTEKSQDWEAKGGGKKFPRMDFLIFLHVVPYIFPASDFRHPITTPAILLMAKMLTKCRVNKIQDIRKGLFICKLILKYTEQSQRYLPEALKFYQLIIGIALKPISSKEMYDKYCLQVGVHCDKINKFKHCPKNATSEREFKFLVGWCLLQLQQVSPILKSSCLSWPRILCPTVDALKLADWGSFPSSVGNLVSNLVELCEEKPKLEKLVAAQRRPKPLKMFEPLIERVTEGRRKQPMSDKKLQSLKLKHKYKREMKGAIREIRRDRDFISKLRLKEAMKSDSERKEKVRQLMGSLSTQAGEINKIDRTKAAKKKGRF